MGHLRFVELRAGQQAYTVHTVLAAIDAAAGVVRPGGTEVPMTDGGGAVPSDRSACG